MCFAPIDCKNIFAIDKKGKPGLPFVECGAGKESRTLDLNLGKVALYQLSYSRVFKPQIIANFPGLCQTWLKNPGFSA